MEITGEDAKICKWITMNNRREGKDNRSFLHQWGPLIMKKCNISKLKQIKYHIQLRQDLKSKLNDEDFIKNVKFNILYQERYRLADVESLDIEQYVEFKIKELEEILSWITN